MRVVILVLVFGIDMIGIFFLIVVLIRLCFGLEIEGIFVLDIWVKDFFFFNKLINLEILL